MSQTNRALIRGERRSQQIRPATLTYTVAGNAMAIPCTPGNLDFFQRLVNFPAGGGFQPMQHLFVKIIRKDIPAAALVPTASFQRGQKVIVTNNDPDSPGCGEAFALTISENCSLQPILMLLNLERELG